MKQGVIVLVVFSLLSCTNNFLFKADKEIKDGWHADSTIVFQFNISDTTNVFYSEINIRHTISYPFQNLFIFLHNTNPLGQTTTDTIECVLADKTGKWKVGLFKVRGDRGDNTRGELLGHGGLDVTPIGTPV